MKKTIFYLFSPFFIYQIVGYIVSFNIIKYNIESEIKAKIKESLNGRDIVKIEKASILKRVGDIYGLSFKFALSD